MKWALGVLFALVVGGCHHRIREQGPGFASARTVASTNVRPYVDFGRSTQQDVRGSLVSMQQGAIEFEVLRRLLDEVDGQAVAWAMEAGAASALGGEAPLAWTGADTYDATLRLEIVAYGLEAPFTGAPPEFVTAVRVRLYTADAKVIYRASQRCRASLPEGRWAPGLWGAWSNKAALDKLDDGQLQAAFEEVAQRCGGEVVEEMLRRAGVER
jgi:hypothetical protein